MAAPGAPRVVDKIITSKTLEILDQALIKLDSLLNASNLSTKQPDGPVPKAAAATPQATLPQAAAAPPPPAKPVPAPTPSNQPAQKAPAAPGAAAAPAAAGDASALFQKVLIKVARVLTVEPVAGSDKLYKLTIDIGGWETRHVCAGLRQYLERAQLEGALVAAVCNLKPAKLAGNLSEAMLLAAEAETPGGLIVRLLVPPAGSEPGDQVFLQGGLASTETVKQLKSDHWKPVASVLRVDGGGMATVGGTPLVTAKGFITVPPEIPDGCAIH